ncbi:MAG: TPD domain-containing protein [Candidatus Altiarchaeota archaeon]
MDRQTYDQIYSLLKSPSDFKNLSEQFSVPSEVLSILLGQKIVRDTTRRYYKVKKMAPQFLRRWSRGETLLKLAQEIEYSPYMTASLILQDNGAGRKGVLSLFRNPDSAPPRLREELRDVLAKEYVYSPKNTQVQVERGRNVESKVGRWLDARGVQYITEEEARRLHKKTPDFLLKSPITVDGAIANWVECKATFGDDFEVKRDYGKQLKYYVEMFGPGCAVYWYELLDDIRYDQITLKTGSYFREHAQS